MICKRAHPCGGLFVYIRWGLPACRVAAWWAEDRARVLPSAAYTATQT